MFTGIITDVGRVAAIEARGDMRFRIETKLPLGDVAIGASIACSGVCLTVIEKGNGWFSVDVSAETLSRTTLNGWTVGTPVNLERSLRLGDELGGHLVSGHVDAIATLVARRPEGDSVRLEFEAPTSVAPYIAEKGSIALDGASLTVNEVADRDGSVRFGVNIIPHTQICTTFGTLNPGDRVNLEVDMLARYVARQRAVG